MQASCGDRIPALRMGLYGPLLDFWLKHFDSEQFIVIASTTLRERPREVIKEVADAMTIPARVGTATARSHVPAKKIDRGTGAEITLPTAILTEVKMFFRPHMIRLKQLLGYGNHGRHESKVQAQQTGVPPRVRLVGDLPWLDDPAFK